MNKTTANMRYKTLNKVLINGFGQFLQQWGISLSEVPTFYTAARWRALGERFSKIK